MALGNAARVTDSAHPQLRRIGGGMVGDGVMLNVLQPGTPLQASDGSHVTFNDDGSVSIDDNPQETAAADRRARRGPDAFDDNLAEDYGLEKDLGTICQYLLEGIQSDEATRQAWVETYNSGMDLLGVKLEKPGSQDNGSISRVRHPALLEAVIKGQSMARAELYPSDGPCKVRNDGDDSTAQIKLADDLAKDMNHYLTVGAPEYYPDSDRGLFYLYYGGVIYKKIYRCPWRERPISECVYAPDLIVSNDATDLMNALRVTHVIPMNLKRVREYQLEEMWRDIELSAPSSAPSSTKVKVGEVSGVAAMNMTTRIEDQQRTIMECYCSLDLSKYGFEEKGAPEDLPLPYRVTLDKDSQEILEIRRDWKKGDKRYQRRKRFVKFGLIPGLGYLDYGFVHIMGNCTRALTGIWRILIDAGMFKSFPGGVKLKSRNTPNEIRPAPGEWVDVDPGVAKSIQDAIMPFPYAEPSPVLLEMAQQIEDKVGKLGGAVEIEVGEGRTNVPVGTMMTMIEQQTQMMTAVHKRLHTAQAEELICIKELFEEEPEDLIRHRKDTPARQWSVRQELQDADLVPASDPNVPARMHRIMQATALSILAQQNPDVYKKIGVQKRLLQTLNIMDTDDILMSQESYDAAHAGGPPPDPKAAAATAKAQVDLAEVQQKGQIATATQASKERLAATESQARAADRDSRERVALIGEETERLRLAEAQQQRVHDQSMDNAGLQASQQGLQNERAGLAAANVNAEEERNQADRHHLVDTLVDHHHRTADRRQADEHKKIEAKTARETAARAAKAKKPAAKPKPSAKRK